MVATRLRMFALFLPFTTAVNVTLFHANPLAYPVTPSNADLGDQAGQVFFNIFEIIQQAFACAIQPPPFGTICGNAEITGHEIGITRLTIEVDAAYGPYAQCNICTQAGVSPLNATHTCEPGEYVCDCYTFGWPPDPLACSGSVGRESLKDTFAGYATYFLCPVSWGNFQTYLCTLGTAAGKLGGHWYSLLADGQRSAWRVVGVQKRVRQDCHQASFYGAVEALAPACFGRCGTPRNTTSQCWAGCFSDAVLGPQARTSTSSTQAGLSAAKLIAAWSAPFETDDPSEGGCPHVSCSMWKQFAATHRYCDAPDAGTPFAIDLESAFAPRCPGFGARECCYVPLGYGGGPAFGTPCSEVCAGVEHEGSDDAYCEMSHQQSEHYGNCLCGPAAAEVSGEVVALHA